MLVGAQQVKPDSLRDRVHLPLTLLRTRMFVALLGPHHNMKYVLIFHDNTRRKMVIMKEKRVLKLKGSEDNGEE